MRILAFTAHFPPSTMGGGLGMYDLLKRMAAIGDSIEVITFRTEKKAPGTETMNKMLVRRLPCYRLFKIYPVPKPSITNLRTLREVCKRRHDIVYTRTRFFSSSFIGFLIAKRKRLPLVHTEPGSAHVYTGNRIVDVIASIYDHTLGAIVIQAAKRVITVCRASNDLVRHLGGKKITTIYNGVDQRVFYPSDKPRSHKTVLFVGRISKAKGIDALNALVGTLGKDETLVTIGDHKDGKLDARVKQLGRKSPAKVAEQMRKATVLVHPTKLEGLPRVVQEALSCGLPVVTTDVGGNSEIIIHGKTGILADSDARIISGVHLLLDSEEVRNTISQNATAFAERFKWTETVEQYRKVFLEAINEGLHCRD